MVAALNAFMRISKAEGESKQGDYKKWIEIQSWEWEVEAESSWTKGSGAAVGKPIPAKMSWEHYWDKSSNVVLTYICRGDSFDKIELHMCKSVGKGTPMPYWKATMTGAFITKVNQAANEEGGITQKVEMVFKSIEIEYLQQGAQFDTKSGSGDPGALSSANIMKWVVDEGTVT